MQVINQLSGVTNCAFDGIGEFEDGISSGDDVFPGIVSTTPWEYSRALTVLGVCIPSGCSVPPHLGPSSTAVVNFDCKPEQRFPVHGFCLAVTTEILGIEYCQSPNS
jgi:hypothetical protein